jgi:hypothetical protein
MILNKHEVRNNTPEQVGLYLQSALDLVDELGPPDDLREAFFTQAVGLLSGKQILVEQMQTSPNGLTLPR